MAFSGALVSRSISDQTIPNEADTAVIFDTEDEDVGGWYDAGSPSIFTVPAGVSRVRVSANIRWIASATGRREATMQIDTGSGFVTFVGGPFDVRDSNVSGNGIQINIHTGSIAVSPGDEFRVLVRQASGGNLNIRNTPARTWFSIVQTE